jgi:hypothetical protein
MKFATLAGLALTGLLCAAAHAQVPYVNVTAGGVLRPGVYGRIDIGRAPPPPVIYPQPVMVSQPLVPPGVRPVYLYVPPGQARKWPQHCARYQACDLPVLFVRMDNSPSRLGRWKNRDDGGADARGHRVAAAP